MPNLRQQGNSSFICDMIITRFGIIAMLAIVVYSANFWGTSIYILDEAKNASCAMEMLQRKDAIVPTFNNVLRTDKPPLHYYFMMTAYSLFGVNPFAARLFSVIAGVLTVITVFVYTKRFIDETTAFFSALTMIASIQLAIQFHLAVPDPYLILLMTLGLLFFLDGFENNKTREMLLCYVVLALASLAKGLIAVVLPGLVVLVYIVLRREFTFGGFKKLKLLIGIPIFLAISVPWYVLVGLKTNGAWLEGFFLKHNLERYTSTMEGHKGFLFLPFLIFFAGLLPASIFLIQAVLRALPQARVNPLLLMSLIMGGVTGLFFSFSKTVLPSYPAPALPFIAIILGWYFNHHFLASSRRRGDTISLVVYSVIMLSVPIAVYIALKQEPALAHLHYLSAWFMVLPVGAITALALYRQHKNKNALYVLNGSWIVTTLIFFYVCFPRVDRTNPVRDSLSHFTKTKSIAWYGSINPAYIFAFKKPVQQLENLEEVVSFAAAHPDATIITYQKFLPELESVLSLKQVYMQKDLFERGKTVVLQRQD